MVDFQNLHEPVLTPGSVFNHALAMHQQGNLKEAEKIYRAFLKREPKNFDALCAVASILWQREHYEDAVYFLRRALNQKPNSAMAHMMLAELLNATGRHEEALERARRAIALSPGVGESYDSLARILATLGRYDEAIDAQSQAIELAPSRPRYYFGLGMLKAWTADDPRIRMLEGLVQGAGSLSSDEQIFLHFALSKAYSDTGDIDRAFRHQIKGGGLKRRATSYDESRTLSDLDDTRTINAEWLRQRQEAGNPSALPIFIVGMPRSGSTLVEQILASHPAVQSAGESALFITALGTVAKNRTALASRLFNDLVSKVGSLYIDALQREVPANSARIVDKTLMNFQFAGLIHAALPNARIVHTQRDPIDTCLSAFSMLFFGQSQPYSYDLGELGRFYRAYDSVMAHWRTVLPADIMLEVRYEDIVEDLEAQARRIIAHCGLPWDDACLSFHNSERAVLTSSHSQVRKPIYRSSVGRPRPSQRLLQPLLDGLGIEATNPIEPA